MSSLRIGVGGDKKREGERGTREEERRWVEEVGWMRERRKKVKQDEKQC